MAQRKQPNINTNKSPSELEGYNLGVFGTWMHKPLFQSSRFYAEWLTRLVNDRDMNVVITASSETGVGKTTLAVTLSLMMDPHGWTADKASVADPQHYNYRYDEVPAGSCLVLDEAEKAMDARRGMSDDAVTLSQTAATAPTSGFKPRRPTWAGSKAKAPSIGSKQTSIMKQIILSVLS